MEEFNDKFNFVKKGYDPQEVNNYIKELNYTIERQKEKDETIKNAIVNAQITADNIINRANAEAARIRADAVKFLDNTLNDVAANKGIVTSFRDEYMEMMQKYSNLFDTDDTDSLINSADKIEKFIAGVKTSIIEKSEDLEQ